MVQRREKGHEQKAAEIAQWIDPNERITIQFDDQRDLSAEVTGCTDHLVSLSLDTAVPHIRQHVSQKTCRITRAILSDRSSESA